mgnify:FL=1
MGQGEALSGVELTADARAGSYGPNRVILTVTDANGLSAIDEVGIDVLVGNYLPTVRRD